MRSIRNNANATTTSLSCGIDCQAAVWLGTRRFHWLPAGPTEVYLFCENHLPRALRCREAGKLAKEDRMAGSLNKVMLIGNLGADPEVRTFQNGGKVCKIGRAHV